jgi:signal transduction histidine kinase
VSNEPDFITLFSNVTRIFHSQATTLTSLALALKPLRVALSPNPFTGQSEPTSQELETAIRDPSIELERYLSQLIDICKPTLEDRGIRHETWANLEKWLQQTRSLSQHIGANAFKPPTLRTLARSIINELTALRTTAKLPKESVKNVITAAQRVESIICLYDLHRAESQIIAMNHDFRALRDYMVSNVQPDEPTRLVVLWELVNSAANSLRDLSEHRHVEMRLKETRENNSIKIVAAEKSLRRAIYNVLHNAVKYSGTLRQGNAWIDVSLKATEASALLIIESWGIPITRNEIDQELIFQLGYRGIFSSQKGQTGSGIGLFDARLTARRHGGDLSIACRPERSGETEEELTIPHITTATFDLPLTGQ